MDIGAIYAYIMKYQLRNVPISDFFKWIISIVLIIIILFFMEKIKIFNNKR